MIKILKQTNQPEITNMPKVDLAIMNGQQLLDLYNSLATAAGKPTRKAKFQSKEEAIERVKAIAADQPQPVAEKAKAVVDKEVKKALAVAEPAPAVERPAVEQKPPAKKPAKKAVVAVKDGKDASVIRVLTEGGVNPRREGSDAYKYFEAMMGGVTVGAYMAAFPSDKDERKKAKQWLWNTKRDGHIELLG